MRVQIAQHRRALAQELLAQRRGTALADQRVQIEPRGIDVGARLALVHAEVAGNPRSTGERDVVPPAASVFSTSNTRSPSVAATVANVIPAAPAPRTTAS
jgi:hypothetical protein